MATQKLSNNPAVSKKEYKKEIAIKIETVLAGLKNTLGEKEFQHRLKKAAKVLTHGLHGKNAADKKEAPKTTPKAVVVKKVKGIKKAALKKVSVQKTATTKKAAK